MEVCSAINSELNNITMPTDENEMLLMLEQWNDRLKKKHGLLAVGLMKGVGLAGDGLVISINNVSLEDLGGRAPSVYHNRKGYPALLVQAFCDSFCRFRFFKIGWPGNVNNLCYYLAFSFI